MTYLPVYGPKLKGEKKADWQRRTFSLISSALLHRGSASLYLPLLPYSTARLLRVAATAGWSFPRVFSRIARASFSRCAASLYLF